MSASENEQPERRGDTWTCPPGYGFPKCRGCGHNFFYLKPQPLEADGRHADGGHCQWCVEESDD